MTSDNGPKGLEPNGRRAAGWLSQSLPDQQAAARRMIADHAAQRTQGREALNRHIEERKQAAPEVDRAARREQLNQALAASKRELTISRQGPGIGRGR
jgi:hypothetical protein